MSELKEVLTDSQLEKHYQLMLYLSKHPNEAFTLAQLDYLLPRGASVQRFPEEWVQAMRDGAGISRSVELVEKEGGPLPPTAANAADRFAEYVLQRAQHIMLVCRRPEVRTLEALSVLLQSPSTQLDAEACVAIHTDQVLLSPGLLHDAQRAGLAYYFPDNYDKNDLRVHTVEAAGVDNSSGRGPDSAADGLLDKVAESCVYPPLPPGVRLHHEHFNIRGLTSKDEHCIPVRLHVGELLFLVFDNATAVERQLGRQHEVAYMKVAHEVRLNGVQVIPGSAECPLEIDVKQRAIGAARGADPSTTRTTKVVMRIAAVRAAPSLKLLLSFPNYLDSTGSALPPCVVNLQVCDESTEMPGVLIGRDRQPVVFSVPERVLLPDRIVNPPPTTTLGRVEADEMEADAQMTPTSGASTLASLPLPWWENSSPLVLGVRDLMYPSKAQVQLATARVFSATALSAAARQQMARHSHQQQRDAMTRRKRRRSRAHMNMTNRHLLHFGLDTSIPCSPDGRS